MFYSGLSKINEIMSKDENKLETFVVFLTDGEDDKNKNSRE